MNKNICLVEECAVPGKRKNVVSNCSRRGCYSSKLEEKVAASIEERSYSFEYESVKIPFIRPEQHCLYCPDFILDNGIVIETKGIFDTEDRRKHILIRKTYPELDIRFVFSRKNAKIYKKSSTTYADFCDKNGFLYAEKDVPDEWLREKPNRKSLVVIRMLKRMRNKDEEQG